MRRQLVIAAAWAVGGALLFSCVAAQAASKAERTEAARQLVENALGQELAGANESRSALLQAALEQDPDHAPARWHSGYLRMGREWVKYDEAPELAEQDRRLEAYRKARSRLPDTLEGHLALAEWCGKRKLTDQRRAHLERVLQFDTNHAAARLALGYQLLDGRWYSATEIAAARERATLENTAFRKWQPILLKLRQALLGDDHRRREAAREELLTIDEPAAIGALEAVFSPASAELAGLALDRFDRIEGPAADLAIARQALLSPWESIRKEAAEKLKAKDKHHWVPHLLAQMAAPIKTRAEFYLADNGRVYYQHAFYRDGQEHQAVTTLDTDYRPILLSRGRPDEIRFAREMLAAARLTDAAFKARMREMFVAQENARAARTNERIVEVLQAATGQRLPAEAEAWWNWWGEEVESYYGGPKPYYATYEYAEVQSQDPLRYSPPLPQPILRSSCFASGTLVWTETGLRPIDEVQVGDRVLSQHPDTGELTYKPVLRTTVRGPQKLVQVTAGDQSVECTGGHLFWVAGRGWHKARELEAGERLHSLEGAVQVTTTGEGRVEPVYNLVVADFHTYFVGEARLLTHDVTSRGPVRTALPGLPHK